MDQSGGGGLGVLIVDSIESLLGMRTPKYANGSSLTLTAPEGTNQSRLGQGQGIPVGIRGANDENATKDAARSSKRSIMEGSRGESFNVGRKGKETLAHGQDVREDKQPAEAIK